MKFWELVKSVKEMRRRAAPQKKAPTGCSEIISVGMVMEG